MRSSYLPSVEFLEAFLGGYPSEGPGPPTLDELLDLVDATFWASLRTEEGRAIRPALSLVPPESAPEASCFSETLPLSVEDLAKLSPALRHPDLHVAIWRRAAGLFVWGLVLAPVEGALRIRATSPGVLRLSAGSNLVATLSGERVQLVAAGQTFQFDGLLTRAFGPTSDPWLRSHQNEYLRHIARRVREHGRGGTLIVVPGSEGSWAKSLRIRHRFASPPEDIVNAWHDETEANRRRTAATMIPTADVSTGSLDEKASAIVAATLARERARVLSDRIGDVTAVDGAAVVTRELALLGFGAKIATSAVPPKILEIRPLVGAAFEPSSLEMLGGMRHQSAARFVTAEPECVVLVVSQDGVVSLFSWLEAEHAVAVARELELLLW
jgi:hypothetical protein